MINEKHFPNQGSIHRKEEAKLAIIRDYLENSLNEDEVVSKYQLSSKQLFFQWIGQRGKVIIFVRTPRSGPVYEKTERQP